MADPEKTIVIRDRRKPNQYTTDNVVAREWMPILRVGDAFFFYSVYLSMANKKTESSWGSLRTMAKYLQCGVDLIIRGNKLLEICELIYIEPGNQRTSNEYYILDPPSLTPDLKNRIYRRLDDIVAHQSSKNWLGWARQVRKALDSHRSLPNIWAERRAKRGGRPVRTLRPQNGVRETQAGLSENGVRDAQSQQAWDTTTAGVSHMLSERDSQTEQEQKTRKHEQEIERTDDIHLLVQSRCLCLGVSPQVLDVLLEKNELSCLVQQLDWLPFRHARDPAAMLVSAVQEGWTQPAQYNSERAQAIWAEWMDVNDDDLEHTNPPGGVELPETDLDAQQVWLSVLKELRMQMTRATFDTWLSGSRVVHARDGEITVRVRDQYAVDWLRNRWIVPIQRTLTGVTGSSMTVRFEV